MRAEIEAAELRGREKGVREAIEVLERHDGCPCAPNKNWPLMEQGMYEHGQLDAALSWKSALLKLLEKPHD